MELKTFSLPAPYHLHLFSVVPSAMDEAHTLASQGAPEKTWVVALKQTAGRGRLGRAWTWLPGNFSGALILRPPLMVREAFALGCVFSLALGETLLTLGVPTQALAYKWPNDVLLGDRKVAGLLVERGPLKGQHAPDALPWMIVGLGVNLAAAPEQISFPATSLSAWHLSPSLETFTALLCRNIDFFWDLWVQQDFETLRLRWLTRAWRLGQEMTVQRDGTLVTGIFKGVDREGRMQLQTFDSSGSASPSSSWYAFSSGDVLAGGHPPHPDQEEDA